MSSVFHKNNKSDWTEVARSRPKRGDRADPDMAISPLVQPSLPPVQLLLPEQHRKTRGILARAKQVLYWVPQKPGTYVCGIIAINAAVQFEFATSGLLNVACDYIGKLFSADPNPSMKQLLDEAGPLYFPEGRYSEVGMRWFVDEFMGRDAFTGIKLKDSNGNLNKEAFVSALLENFNIIAHFRSPYSQDGSEDHWACSACQLEPPVTFALL